MKHSKCLSNPPSLICNSNNYPFLSSSDSAKHDKAERLSAYGEIFIKWIACFSIVESLLKIGILTLCITPNTKVKKNGNIRSFVATYNK